MNTPRVELGMPRATLKISAHASWTRPVLMTRATPRNEHGPCNDPCSATLHCCTVRVSAPCAMKERTRLFCHGPCLTRTASSYCLPSSTYSRILCSHPEINCCSSKTHFLPLLFKIFNSEPDLSTHHPCSQVTAQSGFFLLRSPTFISPQITAPELISTPETSN